MKLGETLYFIFVSYFLKYDALCGIVLLVKYGNLLGALYKTN